jgi:pre-mRNA-splicing factor ISY1
VSSLVDIDWAAACSHLTDVLDLPEGTTPPPFPKANVPTASTSSTKAQKRKADDGDVEMTEATTEGEADKRAKTVEGEGAVDEKLNGNTEASTAAAIASFFGVLDQASMEPPKQPSKEELEIILLDVRKRSLLAEYGV